MTFYTADSTNSTRTWNYYNGTAQNNYSNATTTSSGYNNWDYFNTTSGATTSPYGQIYISTPPGTAYPERLYVRVPSVQEVVYKPTEQELLRQREEKIKAEEAAKKAKEEAEEAARKARLLLAEYLDNENMQRLLGGRPLEIPSRLFGDIKYHIPISNDRIKAWKENKVVTELCLAVKGSGYLPTDDIVLTKLLHVLHDEENMLRTANHFNKYENLLTRLN